MMMKEIMTALFSSRKITEIESILNSHPTLSLTEITDHQGNNLLHQLSFEGQITLLELYVARARQEHTRNSIGTDSTNQPLSGWVNQRNHQGFTPLLYASYSGHLPVLKFLVQQVGADCRSRTNSGLNALHLAAQRNNLLPFLYLRNKIRLDDVDDVGSSPLHWASFMNQEQVVTYILANRQYIEIDRKDSDGNTPLSLAVSYGNTRITRRLLIAGANRYTRNLQGKTPLEIAEESGFQTIGRMLSQEYGVCDMVKFYCNIKMQYKPKSRSLKIPSLFLICFTVVSAILNVFIKFNQTEYFVLQVSILAITLLLYLCLLIPQPVNHPLEWLQLFNRYQNKLRKVCFECRHLSPKRGYHCDICGVCIQQYDHHCTWINNCVGKNNIARFVSFLFSLLATLALTAIVSTLAGLAVINNQPNMFSAWLTLRITPESDLEKYCLLGLFIFSLSASTFFFPVLMLTAVQIKNLCANRTTFEKVRKLADEPGEIKRRKRPEPSWAKNCRVMCSESKGGSFTTVRSSITQNDLLTTEKWQSQQISLEGEQALLKE